MLTVAKAMKESEKELDTIIVRLILSIDRNTDLENAMDTVKLAWELRDYGIVGIDLCGDPSVFAFSSFFCI